MGDDGFVECKSLVKIYRVGESEVQALQGLDLSVSRGELLAMVGPSGSGKSTLLNIIGGLDSPTGGSVSVEGRNLARLSNADLDEYRSRRVGFVWQKPARNLLPYLSARENVELPLTLAGSYAAVSRQWADELLGIVGLSGRAHHTLVQLSGGELQRVAVAVALVNKPILLLADEPTGELDSAASQTIFDMFKRLNESLGITTIVVTHDSRISEQVNRVVAIHDGKTSTERIRVNGAGEMAVADASTVPFQEYVVLDSAGRLQIPQELRDRLQIDDRVELDLLEEGILIRPVSNGNTKRVSERRTVKMGAPAPPVGTKSGSLIQRLISTLLKRKGEGR